MKCVQEADHGDLNFRTLEEEVNAVPDARQSAGEIPMFFGHCKGTIIVLQQCHKNYSL